MTDHYREAERLLGMCVDGEGNPPSAYNIELHHYIDLAQVHATLALATPSVPPCTECGRTSPCDMDCLDKRIARHKAANEARENIPADIPAPSTTGGDLRERVSEAMHDKVCDDVNRGHGFTLRSKDTFALTKAVMSVVSPVLGGLRAEVARYTETNRRLNETVNHLSDRNRNLDKSAGIRAAAIRDLGQQNEALATDVNRYRALSESQAGELADLRSRAVVLPPNWREFLPTVMYDRRDFDTFEAYIDNQCAHGSSPDSGDSKETAEDVKSPAEIQSLDSDGPAPLEPGDLDRCRCAHPYMAHRWDTLACVSDGCGCRRWSSPDSGKAEPGHTHEQWCIWYGGPDPDNSAGLHQCDDEDHAREWLQWYWSDLGSGIARRTVTCSPWVVVESRPASPESTEGCRCGSYEQMTPSGDYSPVPCPVHTEGASDA